MGLTEGRNDEQINDLFTGNTSFFTVPRYQRKYVWEEKNWKQLYDDIEYSLVDDTWSHFIGTFVFQKNEISPQNTEYIIIDGQQRIITLQIMFMAMIAALQSIDTENSDEKEEIDRYIEIVKDLIKRKPPKGYKVERVSIDYDEQYKAISDVVLSDQRPDSVLQRIDKSNILKCFKYYYGLFRCKSFSQLVNYYEKLITTKYVGFNSYTEEYAYNIFETLNARGTQLKQMELMKNYLFHYLLPKDDIDVYKRRWLEVENMLFAYNLDCDDFLYHLFKCKYNIHNIRIDDLYDQIKIKLNKEQENIKDFYSNVIQCVPLYIDVVNCNNSNDEITFILKYYKIKNNKQFRSVLMALFYQSYKGKLAEKVFLHLLLLLRNFLVIYNIRKITANRIDNDVHDLAYRIFGSECERDIVYSVYQFLLKDRSFFDYDDFPSAVKGLRYSNHKRYTIATSGMYVYLFEMMYKKEYADYEYINDYKNWTMEHVVNDSCDDEYVSCMGNLLLLTKKLNGKCRNNTYEIKREKYLGSGFSWVKDYASTQLTEPSKEEIESRTTLIAEKIAELMSFDLQTMNDYVEKTNKVKKFLNKIKVDKKYAGYVQEFESNDYETIRGKISNKYKDQELSALLE